MSAQPTTRDFTTRDFKANATEAMADAQLVGNLKAVRQNFINKRAKSVQELPEFEALRDNAREIKNHTLAHLDLYLEKYAAKVSESGGHVHFATDAEEARRIVLDICRKVDARTVTKGKSMITEEIGLNAYLEENGITPVETDLGEYIIQLRGEAPSHIIAPAVHLNKEQIESDFRRVHTHLDPKRDLTEKTSLLTEARAVLRESFLAADVGITGANFLIAETGTSVIVTNEGNGDLTQILPKVHVVVASIEKVVPTLEDTSQILRLLARSATGQEMSVYTTFSTGPRRKGAFSSEVETGSREEPKVRVSENATRKKHGAQVRGDVDGPEEYHVVILDNGRSAMLGGEFEDMLRCIRCAACMNHCPVYHQIGGHAYGWIYPGPMGSVLTPSLIGVDEAGHLPNASTFCGRCESVCPMKIPLPKMMRHWREREFERNLNPAVARYGLGLWAFFAKRPKLYALSTRIAMKAMRLLGGSKGSFRRLYGVGAWTNYRDFAVPEGETFQAKWKREKTNQSRAMK